VSTIAQPAAGNSYDEVPYESHPYPQTHPSNLFTVATLFGLTPPPVETARVLELGCAAGGNLIPMAEAFPRGAFVGVDLSGRQVADGQKLIADTGLTNVTLRHASILDVDDSYGTFDYVICHGVFSWVPRPVQDTIFDICAKQLAPNGVAYVSYNTYPGWHMRGIIRDMMRYHARKFATPHDRTQQARSFLNFMADTVRQDGHYAALLRSELDSIRRHSDHYLYHDHLEDVNDPLYFHQFVERAAASGLRYLGESRVGLMMPASFGPEIDRAMKLLANDQVQIEQYLDFLRNRMFRETLLVHAGESPNWNIQPECVTRLHVASATRPTRGGQDVRSDEVAEYQTPGGLPVSTNRPLLKAALAVLAEAWPGTVPFEELGRRCRDRIGRTADADGVDDGQALASAAVGGYINGDVLELRGAGVTVATVPGARPTALRFARLQAALGRLATTRRHEVARLSAFETQLLPLLDGTRDRPELERCLTACVTEGRLRLSQNGRPVAGRSETESAVAAEFQGALQNIANQALLVRE
jgi:methyltransferase-like protein/cyclopropane fatty-acyl-phospholipid synthase-like methyltransferase